MKTRNKSKILIGPICDDPAESVSSVNKAFIEGLSDRYEFVTPLANRKHGNTRQAKFNGWNIYYLIKHTTAWGVALLLHRPAVAHYGITTGWALAKGMLFLRLARLTGAVTIGHLHCGAFVSYWKGLSEKQKGKLARVFAKMDAFVVLSEYWRGEVAELTALPLEKIFVVSNPIAGEFEGAALKIPVERDKDVMLAMGVMGRDKGVLDIVSAAAEVRKEFPDFQLIIAGPEREPGILDQVKEWIRVHSLEENVILHGGAWGVAKLEMFQKASIHLLPSYFENFPLVVLEAAAAGQAIIATPVGAIPEFFEDGRSALLVDSGNPSMLASAMLALLKDREERVRLGREARLTFENRLGRNGIMRSLDQIYSAVLLKNPGISSLCSKEGDITSQIKL